MVQRKVPDKLGITHQVYHHTRKVNNKQMLSLEASILNQHQDLKNSRGTDLKKKMMKKKKSGKTKLSELESVRSRQRNSPPPQKHLGASSSSTPNYMKSTSSSDARKDKSQVSSRSPQSVSSSKCKNSTRIAKSGGHNKPSRTSLTSSKTTTSLKLVRALTKAPSFKPVRVSSSKKCPQVVLCESGLDVQRATCSSTLKDSKFPCYLELNPGDTTSAMKVCPYTYCSLNGHHHLQLPPLKSFLSARRLSMKANRNLRKGCSSPCPARPTGVSLAGDVPDWQQEKLDLTIEIYSKEGAKMAKNCSLDSPPQIGPAEPTHCFNGAQEEVEEKGDLFPVLDYSSAGESDMDWEGIVDSTNHNEEPDLKADCLDKICEVIKEPTSLLKAEDEASCSSDDFVAEKMEQKSFDEESVTSEACFLSDEDTNSSISCLGSDFKGSDNQPATHNEDEKETTQTRLLVSDELAEEEICKDFSVPYEEKVILQEDDVMTPMQELHQESKDSHGNNAVPNQCDTTSSESEEATQDESIETSEDGIQKPLENASDQQIYDVENELSSNTKTQKTSKVPEVQNADIEVLPSLRRTSRGHNRLIEEDEPREFNPRGPNFLPLKPVPEAERVDLKHQMMNERKNSEEWMIDYALQQAVSKLAPVRRKRVALLVEAFETVSPIPKCEPRLRQSTNLFPPSRFIQACN